MISKNEIKYIQSLSQKKTRDEEGIFIAEGTKMVNELLKSDIVVKKIYATEEWMEEHKQQTNVIKVAPEELKKISNQTTPNQVVAVVEKKKLIPGPLLKNKIRIAVTTTFAIDIGNRICQPNFMSWSYRYRGQLARNQR